MRTNRALVLKSGIIYFALVFGVGFVLGVVRTLWLVPRFSARAAELVEAPIMLLVTITSARLIVRRLTVPSGRFNRLGMGCVALVFYYCRNLLVLWLRGKSIVDYVASRDPLTGTVYYLLLVVFAITPFLVARSSGENKLS